MAVEPSAQPWADQGSPQPQGPRGPAPLAPAEPRDLLADRVLRIDTPEHVRVSFPLAGPGSRFGALLLDGLLILAALLVVGVLLALLAAVGWISSSFASALTVAFAVFALWGYFFLAELVRNGQTVGKRLFGIRAVRDGGHPLDAQASAIRNLVRLIRSAA